MVSVAIFGFGPLRSICRRRPGKLHFIATFYSHARASRNVQQGVGRVLADLRPDRWGLNAGSSSTRLHPLLINLDICSSPGVDVIGTIEDIPFGNETLHAAVSQEVLEHVADPLRAVREVFRVLVAGARFYVQTPFMMGVHSAPHNYWRVTDYGLRNLFTKAGFEIEELGISMGAGAAVHQTAVEFAAVSAAAAWQRLYLRVKAVAALAMSPLRLADYLTSKISTCNRIPAGYYAIARKP